MSRRTKTYTISLPPEMADKMQELMQEEGRTRSEFIREALRRYMDERRLRILSREISGKMQAAGITAEEQVNELIHDERRT